MLPLLAFVSAALALSCGSGGDSATGVALASPGPALLSIELCQGPAPAPTSTTTPAPTPCPSAVATSVPMSCTINLHALGSFSDGTMSDITSAASTFWGSDSVAILSSDGGGAYTGITPSGAPAMVTAGSGGVSSPMLPVMVGAPVSPCP
jgi:hypothetical protein